MGSLTTKRYFISFDIFRKFIKIICKINTSLRYSKTILKIDAITHLKTQKQIKKDEESKENLFEFERSQIEISQIEPSQVSRKAKY